MSVWSSLVFVLQGYLYAALSSCEAAVRWFGKRIGLQTALSEDAGQRDRSDAGQRDRSDAAQRDRSDAGQRDRSDAAQRDRSDAAQRDRSDAAQRDRSDAGQRDRSDAGQRDCSDAGQRDRSDADQRDRSDAGQRDRSNNSPSSLSVVPLSVNYHFTRQCNYHCGFCFHTAKTSFVLPLEKAKEGLTMLWRKGES